MLEAVESLPRQWTTARPVRKEMDTLLPQSAASRKGEGEGGETRVHDVSTRCVYLEPFPSSPIEGLDLTLWSAVFDCVCRCQGNLSSKAVVFLALSWGGGGALNSYVQPPLPLHARNEALESEIGMKRKSSLPQTPLAQFLEGLRFLHFIFFPELDQLSNWDFAAQDPVEALVNVESSI